MARCLAHSIWGLFVAPLSSTAAEPTLEQRLDTAIQRELEALAKGPRLELPPASEPSEAQPPPGVVEAGEEFVGAWRTWHQLSSLPKPPPKENHPVGKIDATEHGDAFEKLLEQTLTGNPPPLPAEYEHLTYHIDGWCDTNGFSPLFERGYTLAQLRSGDTYSVLQRYSQKLGNAASLLFTAYGVDPEDFAMGQWLACNYGAEHLLPTAKEKTALMLLKLAGQIVDRPPQPAPSSRRQLYMSQWILIDFLRPDNGISETTKQKIADFIATKGSTYAPDYWISHAPKGAGKWMVPIAKLGLQQARTNRIRERSSQILTEAGIPHEPPVPILPPVFRVTIDGQLWPGDLTLNSLGVSLNYSKENPSEDGSFMSGGAFRLNSCGPGLFTYEADSFTAGGKISTLELYDRPFRQSGFQSPLRPWIFGSPALPLKFGEVNEVNIATTRLTIQPALPKSRIHDLDHPIEIDLESENEEVGPPGVNYRTGVHYRINADEPLVLPRLSVGEYWLRARYPGASAMPWTRYKVSREQPVIRPELAFGATIVVPIDIPQEQELKNLPESLGKIGEWFNIDSLVKIQPVAKDYRRVTPASDEALKRFKNSMIFSNLPPGTYEISVPEKTGKATGAQKDYSVEAASIMVTIDDNSPVFVVTKPLSIRFSIQATASPGQ